MTDARWTTITHLSQTERAEEYPYQAPSSSYLILDGKWRAITADEMPDLSHRTALLSVGSNRSPQQLLRKFGAKATLPVTRAIAHDIDIIHSACFSYYGAVPCTAYPSKGTHIALNAVWLTDEQLQIMHDTEAVGIAYDYCKWDAGSVALGDAPQPKAVYGYATRLGYLADDNGAPISLSYLPAQNRRYTALSQQQARRRLIASLPSQLASQDEAHFMKQLISDKAYRMAVNEALGASAKPITQGPWQVIAATPQDADSFL